MQPRWTRKTIIQAILDREAAGLSLSTEPQTGVGTETALYRAAKRIYGSWREALLAAGVTPSRSIPSHKWTPSRVLNAIRKLARRKHPVNIASANERYPGLVSAARRLFGSWKRALFAAGVDPTKFCCPASWTREQVIEGILIRRLRDEPLGYRTTEPRALVDAARRFFGTWGAAKEAAGIDGM